MTQSVLEALQPTSARLNHEASSVQVPRPLDTDTTQPEAGHRAPEVHPVRTDGEALPAAPEKSLDVFTTTFTPQRDPYGLSCFCLLNGRQVWSLDQVSAL